MVMRTHLGPFALALSLALLAAGGSPAWAAQEPERIISAEPTPAGIAVTVQTGGCTKKADFEVSAGPVSNGKATVELHRTKPDTCKGNFPDGLKLQYSWAELNLPQGTQLSVTNPLEAGLGVQPVNPAPVKHFRRSRRHHSHYRRGWHRHHRYRHLHRHHGRCYCPCEM
jgi:hypothetical protein